MLKQPSSEYRGFRTPGIRLSEEMLPMLGTLYHGRTHPMLDTMHAFDKAHAVMLVEQGLLPLRQAELFERQLGEDERIVTNIDERLKAAAAKLEAAVDAIVGS